MTDLWPQDLKRVTKKAPVTILKEQASLLGEKTDYVLQGDVVAISGKSMLEGYRDFAYSFEIVAPALEGYRYRLFAISHGVELYPLRISVEDEIRADMTLSALAGVEAYHLMVDSEEMFLSALREIFNSTKTRQIIEAILAQSQTPD